MQTVTEEQIASKYVNADNFMEAVASGETIDVALAASGITLDEFLKAINNPVFRDTLSTAVEIARLTREQAKR
jgi:hypothetical protein